MSLDNHPCFSEGARHTTGRIHLPVAPECNIQCNFCNRKFDCVNESRPGVTSSVLKPDQAAEYLDEVLTRVPNIAVMGIAGPGDPFANGEKTIRTMELVKAKHPELLLCVATNGLNLAPYAAKLAELGVGHVTVTVNAIDPEIGAKIYSWIRYEKRVYRGVEGARVLFENQVKGIKALKEHGVTVKINTVVIPGVNDQHVPEISAFTAGLGADVQNCIAMYHVVGTMFENIEPPSADFMTRVRSEAGVYLKQMKHCARCRADAVGMIGKDVSGELVDIVKRVTSPKVSAERPYVAVASMEGIFVNQHLGEAAALWIFGMKDGKAELLDRRGTPPTGGGAERWMSMAELIHDCSAILVSGVGKAPQEILEESGIQVIAMEGLASEGVNAILAGREVPKILVKTAGSCGAGKSCGGTGSGCA